MSWYTTKQAAELLGKSERQIRRNIKSEKLKSRIVDGKGGRNGKIYQVWIEDMNDNKKSLSLKIGDAFSEKEARLYQNDIADARPRKSIGVQKGVQVVREEEKEASYKDLVKSFEWIPIEDAVQFSHVSRRTIFSRISNKLLLSVKVKDAYCGHKTFIHIDGFSYEVKKKWKEHQIEVLGKNLPAALANEQKEFELTEFEDRNKAYARKNIIDEYYKQRDYAKKNNKKLSEVRKSFELALNEGKSCVNDLRKLNLSKISIKTIDRWEKLWRDSGNTVYPVCLIEKRKNKSGRKKRISNDVIEKIKEEAVLSRNLSASFILRNVQGVFGFEEFISERYCSKIVKEARKNKYLVAKNKGKTAYKNLIKPHARRFNNALPNLLWESDGHKVNNLVQSPFLFHRNEKFRGLVRPIIIVWYDVCTGMITGFVMCLSENANAVRTSLRDAIENFGVPEQIRVDNGTAFKNCEHHPHVFAGLKKNTEKKRKAIIMRQSGNEGLYKNLGIQKIQYSTPGNPESKCIEPFWNFCLSHFEKAFPVWIGNNILNRPEELKLTNRALHLKYGKEIPSWTQYYELLKQYVNLWNNSKRQILRGSDGNMLSPIEVYEQEVKLNIPSKNWLDNVIRDPYPKVAMISRDEIYCQGLHYNHELFMNYSGQQIQFYYDERNLETIKISNLGGEIWQKPAKLSLVGLQVNDSMQALADTRRREKLGIKVIEKIAASGAITIKEQHAILDQPMEYLIEDQGRLQEEHKTNKTDLFKDKTYKKAKIKTTKDISLIEKKQEEEFINNFKIEEKQTEKPKEEPSKIKQQLNDMKKLMGI